MEKKLTNNGPLKELADKHSIYTMNICSPLLYPINIQEHCCNFTDEAAVLLTL